MHNLSNTIVGPGPDVMLIYKFDCKMILYHLHGIGYPSY